MSFGGLTISFAKPAGASSTTSNLPTSSAQEPDGVDLIGVKSDRKLGDKIHICVNCNFPINTYGRLIPCQHAFCWTCANEACSKKLCHMCSANIEELEQLEACQGIVICAHCLRSFPQEEELRRHIIDTHRPRPSLPGQPPLPQGPRPGGYEHYEESNQGYQDNGYGGAQGPGHWPQGPPPG
eukprot:CAMPEP_0198212740 /NCGR_PEP_ID=MMETSP1445-20131203/27486_1 /TAXON_ID=36898 /ORGANISM="Pyramimonas sp., Strain CCMP2087" /LENGTH=181 /DNA_ID=CAMNT_0043887271 /DNA_START=113 /DNA_END=658 /DNA_ORIENTATION=-